MNELQIREEIAASVVAVLAESATTVEGVLSVVDFQVLYTTDEDGTTATGLQRVNIVNRGSGSESASYGNRRIKNYAAPEAEFPALQWYLANAPAIVGSVPNAASYKIHDLTPHEQLPVQVYDTAGNVLNQAGEVDASKPWYLVVRTGNEAQPFVLLPYVLNPRTQL